MQSQQVARQGIVGIDIGGTFTDVVLYVPPLSSTEVTGVSMYKVPSTPHDPAQGLIEGLLALQAEQSAVVIHGSTVATNALLERKGARCVLITTEGFADVLEIGRQDRPSLYDLMQQRPPVLIPREHRLELAERLDYHGAILRAPTAEDFEQLVGKVAACKPESIAISLPTIKTSNQEATDAVSLEIFKHLISSVAEEMGVTLGRTGYSPNIKERKDYSCACFDAQGRLIAQAAHIPVHLGAMPASVQTAIAQFQEFEPGDVVMLNDPYLGGTHLPDITLVQPVFIAEDPDRSSGELFGFVASRAHHADIGGMSPGSMPMSRELFQEGIIIPPLKLVRRGILNEEVLTLFYRNVRTPWERRGDMDAQMAAGSVGERRLQEMLARYGSRTVHSHAEALLTYSAHLTRVALAQLPTREVEYTDYLDDDGWGSGPLPITAHLCIRDGTLTVDFTGSAPQSVGCVNAVQAIAHSAVFYVVRCLVGEHVPANQGCLEPVTIDIPRGSMLNPRPPAAVAAGNVETSQRIVDVLFGALSQLAPERIPAASQGTMNNLTLGGYDPEKDTIFAYYETMGGGMGARLGADGLSGVHVHMSNTRNTPVEALEMELPLRIRRYELRHGSGGAGRYHRGDGLCREILFLVPMHVTLLTDRRQCAPYGLHGGQPGVWVSIVLNIRELCHNFPAK